MKSSDREKYMIGLLQNISEDALITRETKIKGTTIAKLCEFDGGGYKRVVAWLEAEQPSESVEAEPAEVEEEDEIEKFLLKCLSLYRERKGKYGDSWRVLTPESTANLIEMKANRARKMGRENAKALDEAMDMANYAAMLYVQLNHHD